MGERYDIVMVDSGPAAIFMAIKAVTYLDSIKKYLYFKVRREKI